ncbi:MAG: hypothetical protein WC323_02575 [Patescibacteria group bacterium]
MIKKLKRGVARPPRLPGCRIMAVRRAGGPVAGVSAQGGPASGGRLF